MQIKELGKKAQVTLGNASGAVVAVVALVITVTVGALILQKIFDNQTANTAAANISQNGLKGLIDMSTLFSPVSLVVIAALIIGLLALAFFRGRQ